MFEADSIREWRGQDVVDSDGHRIGALDAVYVESGSEEPAFATVTAGTSGRPRLVFVPLHEAMVGPGYLKVPYDKSRVTDAPSIEPEGDLPADGERELFAHYGMDYTPAGDGARRLVRH